MEQNSLSPNSPDLNPVDYHVWSVPKQWVHSTRIHDINHLKTRLVEKWQKFDQKIIDRVIIKAVASTSEVMHLTRRIL